ncbi:Lipopolysaccharide biosynthesis protein RfbH [Trichinella sp. T8]|nr:Lipopolysaccharide biosynthesis protein RfbH [Trichinella sp. T8]
MNNKMESEPSEQKERLYPGCCDDQERSQLIHLVNRSLNAQKQANHANSRYWYPLSVPSYGVDEVLNAMDSLLRFETTMNRKVADFEKRFANFVGAKHAVMVNSGSSADLLACFACVTPGLALLAPDDEILVPALTWPTQIWSAAMAGLKVKTIDIDPTTLNSNVEQIEQAIGPQTKALFLVHLMGNPCQMEPIVSLCRRRGLVLLEDCCESLNARSNGQHVGTFGAAGTFSFFFSHHLVTMEGGMVVTNDDRFADALRMLRAHGWCRDMLNKPVVPMDRDARFTFTHWGFNVRPTELQGAFGQVQLNRLVQFGQSRNRKFQLIQNYMGKHPELQLPVPYSNTDPCWMFVPITVKPNQRFSRDQLVNFLEQHGVETRPVVVGDLKKQPAAEHFDFLRDSNHSGPELIDQHAFIVGLHPDLEFPGNGFDTTGDVKRLLETFDRFFQQL